MHQNYYFLRQLAEELRPQLVGLTLMDCFSQEKDELVIAFAHARGKNNYYRPFFIKASLRADFGCLYFPEDFNRSRQNSVDLFPALIDLKVLNVRVFKNERALGIEFEKKYTLVFKMFGNRSNILLFHNQEVKEIFHNKLVADTTIELSKLDRTILQNFEAFEAANADHRKLFPTFGKLINQWLDTQLKPELSLARKWEIIKALLKKLEAQQFFTATWEFELTLSLIEIGTIKKKYDKAIEALNDFYISFQRQEVIEKEKGAVLRPLQKKIARTQNYLEDTFTKLVSIENNTKNEELGHILMANLHQIPERLEKVELYDFYRDVPIVIKLKPDLSPLKNAENYYRKSKNERIEKEKAEENLLAKEQELELLKKHFSFVEASENLKELRKYIKVNHLLNEGGVQTPAQLFKQVDFEDFVILIGKNAKNNDLLTKQYSYKEDLWLHARDVSGSHVLVKFRAGKKFPSSVIERAAQIAAWHSKRRTDSLCPVIVTPKKYVRKPKGLADGKVIIDKEEVIMVVPTP